MSSTPSPLEQELEEVLRAIDHYENSMHGGHVPRKGYKPFRREKILALIARHEALLWERAWGIIANAGAVWDSDSAEAKEWREVARAFEAREAYGNWPAILPPGAGEGEV